MSALDNIQSPGQPVYNVAFAVSEGEVYPLKELLAKECGGVFEFVVRGYATDGEDFDETEPTTCTRLAAMLWLQASGAEIEIVLREGA